MTDWETIADRLADELARRPYLVEVNVETEPDSLRRAAGRALLPARRNVTVFAVAPDGSTWNIACQSAAFVRTPPGRVPPGNIPAESRVALDTYRQAKMAPRSNLVDEYTSVFLEATDDLPDDTQQGIEAVLVRLGHCTCDEDNARDPACPVHGD